MRRLRVAVAAMSLDIYLASPNNQLQANAVADIRRVSRYRGKEVSKRPSHIGRTQTATDAGTVMQRNLLHAALTALKLAVSLIEAALVEKERGGALDYCSKPCSSCGHRCAGARGDCPPEGDT